MNPIEFKEVNTVYGKGQDKYLPLPAHKSEDGTVTSCWELTEAEIQEIIKTRRIFISQLTFNKLLQPILPAVNFKI